MAQLRNPELELVPASSSIGAEVWGVDLATPLTESIYKKIRNSLCEWGVLFFKKQNLTPEDHVRLGRYFGELHVSKTITKVKGHPLIAEVRKEPQQKRNIGGNWHSDHSFASEPPLGSILVARELPKTGGDTLFTNMSCAFEKLSEGMQETLRSLNAVHAKKNALDPKNLSLDRQLNETELQSIGSAAEEFSKHPAVIRHPETGREVLYINPTYTVRFDGWSEEESKPLLKFLYDEATKPENTYRFRWEDGSVVFWDNRTVWHYALNDYQGDRRLLHRVSIKGSKPKH
ncbi:MAG: TauD/TfdA family dioxygenase [Rhodospirillaceae bacterium]